jgi:hypothetical protein
MPRPTRLPPGSDGNRRVAFLSERGRDVDPAAVLTRADRNAAGARQAEMGIGSPGKGGPFPPFVAATGADSSDSCEPGTDSAQKLLSIVACGLVP